MKQKPLFNTFSRTRYIIHNIKNGVVTTQKISPIHVDVEETVLSLFLKYYGDFVESTFEIEFELLGCANNNTSQFKTL